jgi:hypothetical protein
MATDNEEPKTEKATENKAAETEAPPGPILDILPFVARALAENKAARREMDKIYDEDMPGLAKAKQIAKIYHGFFRDADVFTEWNCRRVASLLVLFKEEGETEDGRKLRESIEGAIKANWRVIYEHAERSPEPIPFVKFWFSLPKRRDYMARISDYRHPLPPFLPPKMKVNREKSVFDGDFAIMEMCAYLLGKKADNRDPVYMMAMDMHIKEQARIRNGGGYGGFPLTEEQKENAERLWRAIGSKLGSLPATLSEYLNSKTYKENRWDAYTFERKRLGGLPFAIIKHLPANLSRLRQEMEVFASILPRGVEITPEIEEKALAAFIREMTLSAINAMWEDAKETIIFQHFDLEARLGQRERSPLEAENEQLRADLRIDRQKRLDGEKLAGQKQKALEETLAKAGQSAMAAQKELEFLRKKLEREQENSLALKQCLEDLSAQGNIGNAAVAPSELEKAAGLKIVVVAGRGGWQQKMRQKYRNFVFIPADEQNFDLSIIDGADAVVINWKYAGHSMTGKAKQYAKSRGKKVLHIGKSDEAHLLRAIYEKCVLPGGAEDEGGKN